MYLRILLLLIFLMPSLAFAQVPRLKPNPSTISPKPKKEKSHFISPLNKTPKISTKPSSKPKIKPQKQVKKEKKQTHRLSEQPQSKPRKQAKQPRENRPKNRIVEQPQYKPEPKPKEHKPDFRPQPNHRVNTTPQYTPRPQYTPQNNNNRAPQYRPSNQSQKNRGGGGGGSGMSRGQVKKTARDMATKCRADWAKFLFLGKTINIKDDPEIPIEGFSFGLGYRFKYMSLDLEAQIGGLSMDAIEALRAHGSFNIPLFDCFTLSPFGGASFVGKNVFDIMGKQTWDAGIMLEYFFFPFLGVSTRYMANMYMTQTEQKNIHSMMIMMALYF